MRRARHIFLGFLATAFLTTCDTAGQKEYCVSGDAIPFNTRDRLADATITVLEFPEMEMVTGEDGHFEFCGFHTGDEVTLRLTAFEKHPIQTGTITVDHEDVERVTFQVVDYTTYAGLALMVDIVPDEDNLCQMVTTVTRVGKSLYDEGAHGEAGATVTIEPALDPEQGPIYFGADVLPDRDLTETSEDGGVLFVQGEPGEYVWTATKPGVEFTQIKMKCRAGWLINASPPWGLQALE